MSEIYRAKNRVSESVLHIADQFIILSMAYVPWKYTFRIIRYGFGARDNKASRL